MTDKHTGRVVEAGIVPEPNKIWVGNAYNSTDQLDCMAKCALDEQCKSASFNGPFSVNPNICVLAHKNSTQQFKILPSFPGISDVSTAPRCCHCDCDDN